VARSSWVVALCATSGGLLAVLMPVTPDQAARLADDLRRLYSRPASAFERWGHRAPKVVLADGTKADRDVAYRDRPLFVAACERLLNSRRGDDSVLGAWLLGTAAAAQAGAAAGPLIGALGREPGVAFEAANALGRLKAPGAEGPLSWAAGHAAHPTVRAAAALAAESQSAEEAAASASPPRAGPGPLPAAFLRGICWWLEEDRGDGGEGSFQVLRQLGVDWISIHTWDPLQRALDRPDFAQRGAPYAVPHLADFVRKAHAAGLKVLVKPHLEMRGFDPTPAEVALLRGSDEAARRRAIEVVRARARPIMGRHNDIEMTSEADWQAWFAFYRGYALSYARDAQAAGADAFCVGRELDHTVLRREAEWRRLIAEVRIVFKGPLTYSANFDTAARLGFWDALDVIGVAAYFALSHADPSPEALAVGWERALAPFAALSRRVGRPVVFTEFGYPAIRGAAAAPWREEGGPTDVWLQDRLYQAALRAVAAHPFVTGVFPWLFEGVSQPPFRDPSYCIQEKPAAFTLGRWYRGLGLVPEERP
jgi:hypothetical protein